MAGPIVSTPFQRGRPVGWAELEAIRNEIARLKPNSGIGYRLNQSPSGWSLSIPSPMTGGGKKTCPWEVTFKSKGDATDPENWRYLPPYGTIGGVWPDGMNVANDPVLEIKWKDGLVCIVVEFESDAVAVKSAKFDVFEDIPSREADKAYYPIATLATKDNSPIITNFCNQINITVCDLIA